MQRPSGNEDTSVNKLDTKIPAFIVAESLRGRQGEKKLNTKVNKILTVSDNDELL